MPRNQFQKMIFALITVIITVHAYVFYSLYVVNGETLMSLNSASGVIEAITRQGGVYSCWRYYFPKYKTPCGISKPYTFILSYWIDTLNIYFLQHTEINFP